MTLRRFRRSDRDQVTALVNAHAAAVLPGPAASVNRLLQQLEREPGEFVVDPWVRERATLVAEQRGRIVAAAHLLRYYDDDRAGQAYRGMGELRWVLHWPPAPFWSDHDAGARIVDASVELLLASGATRLGADGALPALGVYGVPEQWPHVREVLAAAGFVPGGPAEVVLVAYVQDLLGVAAPSAGLSLRRCVGSSGTRLEAMLEGQRVGYVEVDLRTEASNAIGQDGRWADVGNLRVEPEHRRRGVGRWLLGQAAEWLRLGHVDRLVDYCSENDAGYLAFAAALRFVQVTRTLRGWERPVP